MFLRLPFLFAKPKAQTELKSPSLKILFQESQKYFFALIGLSKTVS